MSARDAAARAPGRVGDRGGWRSNPVQAARRAARQLHSMSAREDGRARRGIEARPARPPGAGGGRADLPRRPASRDTDRDESSARDPRRGCSAAARLSSAPPATAASRGPLREDRVAGRRREERGTTVLPASGGDPSPMPTVTGARRRVSGSIGMTLLGAVMLVVLTWAAARLHVRPQPAAVLYLGLVVLVALRGRTVPALVIAVVGTTVWDRVFTGPSVGPGERIFRDVVTFVAACATAVVISRLVAALRVSEARFRALVEHNETLISILDGRAQLVYASPSYTRALGYTPEELYAMADVWALVHPEDVAYAREQLAELACRQGVTLPRPLR
jgi:PAS domain-containing protein